MFLQGDCVHYCHTYRHGHVRACAWPPAPAACAYTRFTAGGLQVNCDFTRTVLHGYLDGELDATGAAEFERHLEGCRECTTALGAEESLRSSLHRSGLYENAPVALRKRIRAGLDAATASSGGIRIPTRRWLAVAASILIVASV